MESDKQPSNIELSANDFRKLGYQLVDDIADFLAHIGDRTITPGEEPSTLNDILGEAHLPEIGSSPKHILDRSKNLLFNHSLLSGHPKSFGYIIPSSAPLGALADLLASAVNPNVGAHILSPIATQIEIQTVSWLCEFIGVPKTYGGLLVSGGNMANFTAFLAARTAKAPETIKANGISSTDKLTVYCSNATHTWIEKAVHLFGLGTDAIRWVNTSDGNQIDVESLSQQIELDIKNGFNPIMVVASAGDVSTGVTDDLEGVAAVCQRHNIWFHVDGAYGAPAAILPEFKEQFSALKYADSIALDPHKWLYAPLEAGCTLVKNPEHLKDTFSSHPNYYNFALEGEEPRLNYYEFGMQNSRGFRALKVWMLLQQAGKKGYQELIRHDISMAKYFSKLVHQEADLECVTVNLSICTFRFIPVEMEGKNERYLNHLNESIVNRLQRDGKVFLSNAVVNKQYCLRVCIMNFRTTEKHIAESIAEVINVGTALHETLHNKWMG